MKDASTSIKRGTFGRQIICLVVLMLGLSASASAQLSTSTTSGTTPLGIAPGAPAGSYALSGFESVNPYNGALNFRLPLLHVGGRGGVQHTLQVVAEQHWRVDKNQTATVGYIYDPNPNRWSTIDPGFSPGTLVGRRTGLSQAQGLLVYCPDNAIALTRFTFTAADGTEYELRDVQSNGQTMDNVYQPDPGNQFSCQLVTTHVRGRVFVTSDGSAATFISDTEINDHSETGDPFSLPQELVYPAGYLFMRDGTCYRIDGGKVLWIRDRNGNRMAFTYGADGVTNITDSLNRVVTIDYKVLDPVRNQNYDLITYKGFGGVARTIKLWYSKLKFALRPDFGTQAQTYAFLFPALDGSANTGYDPKVVYEIDLPDGRNYQLRYNYYGELARVDLPTGGRIEYDYAAGVTGSDTSGVVIGVNSGGTVKNVYRRVSERRVYKDAGTTLELKETYSRPEDNSGGNQGYVEVQHLAGDGVTILARDRHFYFGSPKSSFLKEPYQYPNWQDGKEYKTELYDNGAGGALLRTVDNTWEQRPQSGWWGLDSSIATAPPVDTRLTRVQSTLNDSNQVSKQEFVYDGFNNKTEVKDYGFGTGVPGSMVRRAVTTFLTSNLGVNYTTVNPNTTNPDPNATIHLRSLPLQESTYDAGSAEKARVTFEYDNYTSGLTNRVSISGHASTLAQPTHTVSYLTRGNVTAQTGWDLPSTQLTTRMQYDIAGNAVSVTDPKNNPPTLFDFSDRYGVPDNEARDNSQSKPELGLQVTYAFATLVTNALGHTAYTQYDYYLGKRVNGEDANGVVAKGRYDDLLDRGTELVVATGTSLQTRTLFTYNDPAHLITTNSDQSLFTDGALKSESVYDGLGRTTETRHYETTSAYIATLQNYDGLGRVIQTSNPYRPATESVLWTTTVYDGLGRVLTVTTPDNAAVTTTYLGNATTVRDQANKQRRSFNDALGRLTSVDEILEYPSAGIYATTTYGYDVLDDLTNVTQGTQTPRTFVYDSLKRLKQAANPESGSTNYTYDPNSNLFTKQDARLITTTYGYDALNRAQTRTYTNDPQFTPHVTYSYDAPVVPYSKGRLTQVTSSVSTGDYLEYDQLGRLKQSRQTTTGGAAQGYTTGYGYNLAGAMTAETYPSGRVITTGFDTAGRINQISGQMASEPNKTYASQFSYAAHGAVAAMQLGNGKWEHTSFNNRLQPTLIGLGTTGTDSSTLKLDYTYGSMSNNGNVQTQTITIGGTVMSQGYVYDALNRLSSATETAAWTQTYDYDRWGNRAVRAGSHIPTPRQTPTSNSPSDLPLLFNQSNNRIIATAEYGYDAVGNLTSMPNKTQGFPADTMTYDAENRQLTFDGTVGQYSYDGDGHRVKKIDSTGTTVFVYNVGGQLIAEYHNDPVPPPAGGGGTSYLTSDHLGSTRVVTDGQGNVKSRYDYIPFGEEIGSSVGSRSSVPGYAGPDSTRQKFTQKERDNESGLDYFLARYYSSAQGRFTSVDPNETVLTRQTSSESGEGEFRADLAQPQHWNRYSYVLNNPLRLIDPDGRKWTESVQLGNAMLKVFAPPGTVLDLGNFLAHTRGVNFFYKDPGIAWAKISTAGGTPENGGCILGCWETYEAQPVALSLNLRFDTDEKTGNITGVAVDLGRQDVISSGQNPLRTVWSPLPGLGRPAAEVTSVQINTSVLRGLTNQQLQGLGNAFRRPQQGPLGPIATAISQAVANEQKRRQEEERKRQEEEKKKKH